MTVAIALERFIAVHYPINYSQAMHEANALTKRIIKYVSAVTLLSTLFTITRFFEAKVEYMEEWDPRTNTTTTFPVLEPTEMRTGTPCMPMSSLNKWLHSQVTPKSLPSHTTYFDANYIRLPPSHRDASTMQL